MLQIYQEMGSIAEDFPDLVSRVKMGHSFENRPMYVLKVRLHALQRAGLPVASEAALQDLLDVRQETELGDVCQGSDLV